MANKSVFATLMGKLLPRTDAVNHEGAQSYALSPKEALAQLASTGTFNATFYADAREQLDGVLELVAHVDAEFLGKLAVYAWEENGMKDMPAFLLALLSSLESDAFERAFPRVVRNGKMLRNFVQVMRSGATGRKSLGTRPKRQVLAWLERASDRDIMGASVGNDPSLADVLKMVHPKPASPTRAALYGYLLGKPHDVSALPEVVRELEAFRRNPNAPVPAVPFQLLSGLPLTREHWVEVARHAGWQMLRQNLNTFARHGVFEVEGFAEALAERLRDPDAVRRSRAFPYQLMVAFENAVPAVPGVVREALQDAMEVALENVPAMPGRVVVCPDVSGSMGSPVTGFRKGATSTVRCIDVAALVAAAILRRNRHARVLPFENRVVDVALNGRDSVMTNARKLAAVGGGGTNCSAPLALLNRERASVDLVVMVSDNQSWVDAQAHSHQGTGTMREWAVLKARNPRAKLVCIDIQPYRTVQAPVGGDVLHVGGFSDRVFGVIGAALDGSNPAHWVERIEAVRL